MHTYKSNGYTEISNAILECLIQTKFPSASYLQIILMILRKTYGYKKKMDRISFSQFTEQTGLALSTVQKCIKDLVAWGVIRREVNGKSVKYGYAKKACDWDIGKTKTPRNNIPSARHTSTERTVQNHTERTTTQKKRKKLIQKKTKASGPSKKKLGNRLGPFLDKYPALKNHVADLEKNGWPKIRMALGESLKRSQHEQAIIDCLKYIWLNQRNIRDMHQYYWKTIRIRSQNYYAAEHEKEHEIFKKRPDDSAEQLGSIMKRIGEEVN